MNEDRRNIAETILEHAEANSVNPVPPGADQVILGHNMSVHDLSKYRDAPQRLRRSIHLHTLESFTAYLQAWEESSSIVLANRETIKLQAIIDEHSRHDGPSWCEHVAGYAPSFSREWLMWTTKDNVKQSQTEFVEYLEDRIDDFLAPTGTEIVAIAAKFKIVRRATFASEVNLHSGDVEFAYTKASDTGTIEVPEVFRLQLAVFEKGQKYAVEARFRYRVTDNGELSLWYQLTDPERYIDHAFDEVCDDVQNTVLTKVLRGSL